MSERSELEALDASLAATLAATWGTTWRATRREVEALGATPDRPGAERVARRYATRATGAAATAARATEETAARAAGLSVAHAARATGTLAPVVPLRPTPGLRASFVRAATADLSALVDAVVRASGSARRVVAEARSVVGRALSRHLTIGRTATYRAAREAARAVYVAAPDVRGWEWVSRLDARTCPACWAMHGTWHPASTPMAAHLSCRCLARPANAPDPTPEGAARLAALSPDERRRILGPGRADAYERGDLALADMVTLRQSPHGATVAVAPLRKRG